MAKKDVKKANTTRARKAEQHKKMSKERANDQAFIKAAYLSGNGEVVIEDILKKARLWQAANAKIAQDGVGARPTGFKLEDGTQEIENIYLTPVQRASYLDKNAGLQAMIDYIERQLTVPNADNNPKPANAKKKKPVQTV